MNRKTARWLAPLLLLAVFGTVATVFYLRSDQSALEGGTLITFDVRDAK